MRARIGFSISWSFLSRSIRRVTKGRFSHVWILLDKAFLGHDMVMQADNETGGFHLIKYETFTLSNEVIVLVSPGVPIDDGVLKASSWLGRPYDYFGFFGTAIVLLGRWLHRKWRNPWKSSRELNCAEAVVRILQISGYPDSERLDPSGTTPQDLYEFLKLR